MNLGNSLFHAEHIHKNVRIKLVCKNDAEF